MAVPVITLAEAIKDGLNVNVGSVFNPPLAAERKYQLFYELAEAVTPKVTVYPTSDQTEGKVDHARWSHELTIDVAIQQKLQDDADAEKDTLVNLADGVCEYVKTNRPVGPWKLMTATVQPNLQNEILRQNKLFTSVVRFTFIQHR
jgi:hypothetical protein